MANKIRLYFLFCLSLFLFLNPTSFLGQEAGAQIRLSDYLQELEQTFEVKFSYADEQINQKQIAPSNFEDLDEILTYIESKTQLKIQKLSERYYALSLKETLNICATVLDNFEQNTVMGATVEVLSSKIFKVTDENGGFYIENVPKDAVLRISYLGYKNLIVAASDLTHDQPCKTLLLSQFYQQLEEVVVYEFLTKGIIKQTDGSFQINSEEFGVLPGLIEPDVLQTVQALPGIESVDETVSDINIRGGSNDQNLILWDGIKMYQSGHFFGLISAFNPYLTDEVTLIKNGTSSRYGDGVSGIIDIRTKDNIEDQLYGGAGINLIGGDAYAHVPISDKLAVQFSARRSITDLISTPTYEKFFTRVFDDNEVSQDGNFYFYDFTGKLLYNLNDSQKIRFSFININNLLDYSETEMESNEKTQSSLDQTNLSFGGSWQSNWNDVLTSNLSTYYTRYELGAKNITSNALQVLFQNNEVEELSAKLSADYSPNDFFQWSNGVQYTETGISNTTDVTQPPFQSNVRNVVRSSALFSEAQYRSENQKLFLRGGVRLNYLENPNSFKKFIPEPRFSMNYSITREFKIQALGEFKSQATNQILDLEQNFLGIEKRRWIVSDGETLPVTKSKQGSFGFNYDAQNFYVGAEAFYKLVEGISTSTQGFQNQNQFNGEIGEYEVKGLEFLINRKTDIYSIWASYTYNLNNYRFDEVLPPEFPNNLDIRHTATFAGTYNLNQLKFGVGLNYRSGRPFTEPDASDPIDSTFFPNRINYNTPNSSRLPEYLRADASVIYQFDLSRSLKASAGISVLNITSRKNILNTYYQLNEENEIETISTTSLGITPNASFRVRF
ncbi:TonB-dependent receptor [Euzebyella marina]|uniref:TonB-dependent receptor n=1 Tax=Euzebyella marina TaxID=1761453 RepID=A0A3G2L9M5_9FLAO|nr:carboxypeptidase-like regulatory domain-containing protein [Euzebyella marina]AYN68957.1 TonB-dependent receptor [Euzebyella marina]